MDFHVHIIFMYAFQTQVKYITVQQVADM